MWLELGYDSDCFLSAPRPNYKETGLVPAGKDVAHVICLIDSIGLAVIEYITINGFTGLCNSCKGIIKDNQDSYSKAIIANRCKILSTVLHLWWERVRAIGGVVVWHVNNMPK